MEGGILVKATLEGPEIKNAAFQPWLRVIITGIRFSARDRAMKSLRSGNSGKVCLKKESPAAWRERRLVVNVSLKLLHDRPILRLLLVEHLELPVGPGLLPGFRPERLSSHLFSRAGRPRRFLTR